MTTAAFKQVHSGMFKLSRVVRQGSFVENYIYHCMAKRCWPNLKLCMRTVLGSQMNM